jgi:hypothetical protein
MTEEETFDALRRTHLDTVAVDIWKDYMCIICVYPVGSRPAFASYLSDEYTGPHKYERDAILARHYWTLTSYRKAIYETRYN